MNKLLCGLLGAIALCAAAPSSHAAPAPDLVQTIQYERPHYGDARPYFNRHRRPYHRPFFHRPVFHRPGFHRGPPPFRHY